MAGGLRGVAGKGRQGETQADTYMGFFMGCRGDREGWVAGSQAHVLSSASAPFIPMRASGTPESLVWATCLSNLVAADSPRAATAASSLFTAVKVN